MIDQAETPAALFQLTGVGVVQTDMATGRFVRANGTFCGMVGYSETELRGMAYVELTHPDDRERDAESFGALQRGESRGGTSLTRCVGKDGTVVCLELHVTVIGEGNEALNVAVVNDVTERRRTEETLSESEARFHAFVTTSSDVVYSMSADWTQMRSLVGRDFIPDTDDPNSSWLETYIHPDDRPQVLNVISEAVRTRSIFELEHRVMRVDGSPGWAHSRAIPLLDASGDVTG
jgi:PAS domain S-box-containing protein